MPIITIYQGASGEGQELAEAVAHDLGYRSVGREVLVEASRRYRIPEAKLSDIVEKGPHWWERLLEDVRPYRIALQAALCELARESKLVYHGHLGHELLPGISHVLKVLLSAPIEYRVKQVRARQGLTDGSARKYIDELDKARSRRLMEMFGSDWRNPNRYDLVLNMGKMHRESAKHIILAAANLEQYQPTPASLQAFNDLAIAARVHATLIASPHLQGLSVEVRAEAGHVHVKGRIDHGLEDEIMMIVKNAPGVIKVTTDLYSVPPEALLGA
ncbi:MAG TPA: cytidylate kinase family protein [Candidatus Binatia bacterium]|jgi:cytidylate kinase|nr:cytidylate kinase family protein [Candidatus Binatia bacterium]